MFIYSFIYWFYFHLHLPKDDVRVSFSKWWLLIFRIMCTIGGLGRHIGRYIGRYIGRLSTHYRSTIGRQSTDYRSTIQWTDISADSRPINVHISADISADSRSIYRSTIGRLSVDYRLTIGRPSVDYQSTIGRLSVDRYIGRQIYRMNDVDS